MSDMSPAVRVRGLVKSYGPVQAVRGIDLDIHPGEIFALLGPNGAGKTTTIEILEGYRSRDSGEVLVLGHDPGRERAKIKPRVGIVLQKTGVDRYLTVAETIQLFASYYPRPRPVDEVIDLVGLDAKRGARVTTLSGGQLRRLDMAVALAGDPDLLFLDEPTNGLDPKGRDEMLELVRDLAHNKGVNLILSSHLLPDVEYTCDHVVVMDRGRVATAGPITALKQPRGQVYELRVKAPNGDRAPFLRALEAAGLEFHTADEDLMRVFVPGDGGARQLFTFAASAGIQVRHLRPSVPTLEDVFAHAVGEN